MELDDYIGIKGDEEGIEELVIRRKDKKERKAIVLKPLYKKPIEHIKKDLNYKAILDRLLKCPTSIVSIREVISVSLVL